MLSGSPPEVAKDLKPLDVIPDTTHLCKQDIQTIQGRRDAECERDCRVVQR